MADWDDDIAKILTALEAGGVDLRVDLSPDLLRQAMTDAWQYGYTTGMAHSVKIAEQLNPPDPTRQLAEWLLTLDDPNNPTGVEDRRTITLTNIIEKAREALTPPVWNPMSQNIDHPS